MKKQKRRRSPKRRSRKRRSELDSTKPYGGNNVTQIRNKADLDNFANKTPKFVLIVHAPWCGHCKNMEEEVRKASSKSVTPFVAIDADDNKWVSKPPGVEGQPGEGLGVQGYPTIFLKNENGTYNHHEGGRTISDLKSLANK